MNHCQKLATELITHGHLISLDDALYLQQMDYDMAQIESVDVHGFQDIDISDVDYFEYIDQNH
jgi:hypothetical protein